MASILGHAIADALGVPVEFQNREDLAAIPVTDYRGYGTHWVPAGTWSDDTSMTLATLDSLARGLDLPDMMQQFVDWASKNDYTATGKVFDIGITTRRALQNFSNRKPLSQWGLGEENDNGNGSLMRIIPAVFYCRYLYLDTSLEEQMQIIHSISRLTHAHPRSLIGCGIYAFVLNRLLDCGSKSSVAAALQDAKNYYNAQPEFAHELYYYHRLFEPEFQTLPEEQIKSTGYVVHTLEAALWCFLNTKSYRECVLKAVNLGSDTDTVGAVAGGLAGALYGLSAIPESWKERLLSKQLLMDICQRFITNLSVTSTLIYDESRILYHRERELQRLEQIRLKNIHLFAQRMSAQLKKPHFQEAELRTLDTFNIACLAFGFTTDLQSLGSDYRRTFALDSYAMQTPWGFARVAHRLSDPQVLGSVIYAKWHNITNLPDGKLLAHRNWFSLAFQRLQEISSNVPLVRAPLPYLLDTHGHYVFGLDDGPPDIDTALKMLQTAHTQGVLDVICTSHSDFQKEHYLENLALLQQNLRRRNSPVRLHKGSEILCHDTNIASILEQLQQGVIFPLANSNYLLLEFHPEITDESLVKVLQQVVRNGYRPVIAHMERYPNLANNNNLLHYLKRSQIPV